MKSYNTIVGLLDKKADVCYAVKYSRTTSKQVSQYFNNIFLLHRVIFIETFANRTSGTVAGKLVYPIADTFVVQWEEMHKVYPKSVCWGWIY